MKKNTIIKSLVVGFLTLASVGCGSKSGTYTLSQTGPYQFNQCTSMSIPLTDSSNTVSATGSNGVCSVTLNGTDNGSSLTVTSYIVQLLSTQYSGSMSSSYNQCTYQGTLTESGNSFTGQLTSITNPSLCTALSLTVTKSN